MHLELHVHVQGHKQELRGSNVWCEKQIENYVMKIMLMRTPDFFVDDKVQKTHLKGKEYKPTERISRRHSTCTGTQYMYLYSVHSTCMYEYCIRFFTKVLNFLKCKKMKENVGISKHKAQSTCTIHMNATVILVAHINLYK